MTKMTQTSSYFTNRAAMALAVLLVAASAALAQSTMVKGNVDDIKGQAMAGITITIEMV